MNTDKTFIIAELSANHNQDKDLALRTIRAMAEAGADAVKLQTYTADCLTLDCDAAPFRIAQGTLWDGQTFHQLYSRAYMPWEWHQELFDLAHSLGMLCFSSPFSKRGVDFLEDLGNPIYKIASFEITDLPFLRYVASKGKPMIISTGIATLQEVEEAVNTCRDAGCADITLLKCTSSYPAPISRANLKAMQLLRERFSVAVGVSDHSLGNEVALAAVALGAKVVEKHFILNRSAGGVDSTFSMEPAEFKAMVSSIRNVEASLGSGDWILDEDAQRSRRFARSLFVSQDIPAGAVFTEENLRSVRPSDGLAPKYQDAILGRPATRALSKGTPLSWDMVDGGAPSSEATI